MNSKKIFDSENSKAVAFEMIEKEYFHGNFGSLNKSQVDLLMFHLYLVECKRVGIKINDYELSKRLGIVQNRVRLLRKKEALVYQSDIDWKKDFLELAKKPLLKEDNIFSISIESPVVLLEVQHYLEEKGVVVELGRNRKILNIPIVEYVEMIIEFSSEIEEIDSDEEKKKLIKKLNEEFQHNQEVAVKITADNYKQVLKTKGVDLLKIAISALNPGSYAINILSLALDVLIK